jgi:hypothetical protein
MPRRRFGDLNGNWLTFMGRPSLPQGFKRELTGDLPYLSIGSV